MPTGSINSQHSLKSKTEQMKQLLINGTDLKWLTERQTVSTGVFQRVSSNYRPTTCSSTMWNIILYIIVAKTSQYIDQYMSTAQLASVRTPQVPDISSNYRQKSHCWAHNTQTWILTGFIKKKLMTKC